MSFDNVGRKRPERRERERTASLELRPRMADMSALCILGARWQYELAEGRGVGGAV